MKRYSLFFLILFSSFSCIAQRHLSFMGIPIDGTISSFEIKLKAKGVMPDTEINKSLPYGERMYNGIYIGRKCSIKVRYTGKTKTVYGVEISFSDENQSRVNSFESDFVEGVKKKYKDNHLMGDDNLSDKTIYVYNTTGIENFSWDNVIGIFKTEWMTIFAKPKDEYPDLKKKVIRSVKIYYIDKTNTELRDEENASDI